MCIRVYERDGDEIIQMHYLGISLRNAIDFDSGNEFIGELLCLTPLDTIFLMLYES